jgi:hypothetical protein
MNNGAEGIRGLPPERGRCVPGNKPFQTGRLNPTESGSLTGKQ